MNKKNFIILAIIVLVVVIAVFSFYFLKFPNAINNGKSDWGVFGDFVGGTLNPLLSFFGFLALLYTVLIQHEQLKIGKFENIFFTLFDLHKCVLADVLQSNKLQQETYDIWNLKLDHAKVQLKDKLLWRQYSKALHSLLRFINANSLSSENKKMYSDIVKLLLPDDVLKLLLIECHRDNHEYKSLIEKYALFENASFSVNLDEEAEKIIALAFDGKAIIYDAKKFYDPKAFGQ